MGIRRRALAVLLAAVVVGAVSACATGVGGPSPTPSRSVRASAPSPSPSPTVATTGTIVLGPQNTQILDASGAVTATIAYDESPRTALDALVAAIGASPAPDTDPSSVDVWHIGGTYLRWQGLILSTYETGGPGAEGKGLSIFQLIADGPTVGSLAVEGPSHVKVGDSAASARKVADPNANPANEPTTVSLAHWTRSGTNPGGGDSLTDWVTAETKDGKVSDLRATTFDYGS